MLLGPALTGVALTGRANAQAVNRTDTPKQGAVRLRFDPRIMTWNAEFVNASLMPLGAPLTGDTVGAVGIPVIARIQEDVRTASGIPGFIASIGQGTFNATQDIRVMPFTAEFGLTDRFSIGVTVPVVRSAMRTHFVLSDSGASLGANPFARAAGADVQYDAFFNQFGSALTQLGNNIAAGAYGCPSGPQCAGAQALLAQGTAVRDALHRTVYGVGATGSPFVPLAGSDAGIGIATTVQQMQNQLQTLYGVGGFTDQFLLSTDTLNTDEFASLLNDATYGFGYNQFRNTWRYGLGDVALQAKLRLGGNPYAVSLAGQVRLPTGARDTILEVLDLPIAAHQTAYEVTLTQELTVARHLWLNLAVRAGTAMGSTRARRVASVDAFLVPFQATTVLNWDVGDYLAVDFAPLYRFTPTFAVGFTASYWTQRADLYTYQSVQDSLDLAGRLGGPTPASVLYQGTDREALRVGLAVTYAGPKVEGGFTVEKTLNGEGGPVAETTVFRIVMRVDWKMF